MYPCRVRISKENPKPTPILRKPFTLKTAFSLGVKRTEEGMNISEKKTTSLPAITQFLGEATKSRLELLVSKIP